AILAFTLGQRRLGPLARADVGVGAGHAQHATPLISLGGGARLHPHKVTVSVPYAVLELEVRGLAVQVSFDRGAGALLVVGVDAGEPFVDAVGDLVVGVADDLLPPR